MKPLTCLRCGFTWTPKIAKPKSCPGCHSYKWDKARKG